ncbi:MAG: hypothetical protein K5979_00960 [Ruminococcus sp.]|jgi:hypothetical protein|nr:hypothetical protein [Ruminococcus sp.]
MNPMALLKIKPLFQTFCQDHPKLLMFFAAAGKTIDLDSIVEITVKTSEGKTMKTNIKVNENDIALFNEMGKLINKQQ